MSQTNKETTPEEKGAKFLEWVGQNQKELKKALRANVEYDPDIFEDAFADTILNVYNAIVRNNTDLDSPKDYFFFAAKFCYNGKKKRKAREREILLSEYYENLGNIPDVTPETEESDRERQNEINQSLKKAREILTEEYGEELTDLFFTYWIGRTLKGGMQYKDIADKLGRDLSGVKMQLYGMKKFLIEEAPSLLRVLIDEDNADY